MRRPVWFVAVAALLAVALISLGGCSHKVVQSDLTNPDLTKKPATETPQTTPPAENKTAETTPEEKLGGYPDVYFAYDDANLSDEARQVLSGSAAKLSKNGDKVEVQGNCDERGSVEYNLALGERRAASVKSYLLSYGIAGSRVTTVSFGKEKPVDTGHDESAWAKNRRAHFAVQ